MIYRHGGFSLDLNRENRARIIYGCGLYMGNYSTLIYNSYSYIITNISNNA